MSSIAVVHNGNHAVIVIYTHISSDELFIGGDAMDMVLGFLPASVKPEGEKQSTKPEAGERYEVCQTCRKTIDFQIEYGVYSVRDRSGVLLHWHIFPCLAGPEEYDV